jgi:probable rRNA maturation factor
MPIAERPVVTLVEILVQSSLWKQHGDAETALRKAIAEAALMLADNSVAVVPPGEATAGELAVVLTDDAGIRQLNRCFRNIDRPTNVLSFAPSRRVPGRMPAMLGDIVIAFETAAREAAADGKPLVHHVAHLGVHGFLHLMGYDHRRDVEADLMERLERSILARLDVPDPYGSETEVGGNA